MAKTSVWKISKGTDHLYLGGTIHILPPEQFPLPEAFEHAFIHSDTLWLETELPDENDSQAQQKMLKQLYYPKQQKLTDFISTETKELLIHYFADFNIPLSQFNNFKPGLVMSLTAVLEAKKAQLFGEGVDAYFATKAKKSGKKLHYLESLDFQLNMLANIGQGHEDEFLQTNMSQMSSFKSMMLDIMTSWRTGDLKGLERIIVSSTKVEDPLSYKALFVDRNNNWLPKITALFDNKNKEFVLVGAGHLPGKDGLLTLLEKQGYKVIQQP